MNSSAKFKSNVKSIEQLPNDIFLEIFQYLNGPDIVYAFSPLNTRLQNLLIKWVNIFDLTSITREKFYYVIHHHDVHRWRSLRLNNSNQTPGQIELFCQLFESVDNICQLESLSILNMKCQLATKVLQRMVSFQNLISLTITTVCGKDIQSFQLPSLRRLSFSGCKFNDWIKNFHSLRTLEHTIDYLCHGDHRLTLPKTLQQLQLFYCETRDGADLRISLRDMSQLTRLALYDQGDYSPFPNGWTWENLIKSSLPLLQTFQFCFHFVNYPNTSNTIDQSISLFATPFYVKEKRWFIQCDSSSLYPAMGVIYTLPFTFAQLRIGIKSYDTSVSTLLTTNTNKVKYMSYDRVQTLLFTTECEILNQKFFTFNIVRLILKSNIPRSCFSILKTLRHLEFQQHVYMSANDFADFLTNATQLQSLTLLVNLLVQLTDSFKHKTVCSQLCERIESLTLTGCLSDQSCNSTIEYQKLFSRMIDTFRGQCKHLSLNLVSFPELAKPIFQNMRNLQSLNMYYPEWRNKSSDDAVNWFQRSVLEVDASNIIYNSDDANFYVWIKSRA